jgi:hypothetical protein
MMMTLRKKILSLFYYFRYSRINLNVYIIDVRCGPIMNVRKKTLSLFYDFRYSRIDLNMYMIEF